MLSDLYINRRALLMESFLLFFYLFVFIIGKPSIANGMISALPFLMIYDYSRLTAHNAEKSEFIAYQRTLPLKGGLIAGVRYINSVLALILFIGMNFIVYGLFFGFGQVFTASFFLSRTVYSILAGTLVMIFFNCLYFSKGLKIVHRVYLIVSIFFIAAIILMVKMERREGLLWLAKLSKLSASPLGLILTLLVAGLLLFLSWLVSSYLLKRREY